MIHIYFRTFIITAILLFSSLFTHADIIVFTDGGREEGYISNEGAHIRVRMRGKQGEYTVPTQRVAEIRYDVWLDDDTKDATPVSKKFTDTTVDASPPVAQTKTLNPEMAEEKLSPDNAEDKLKEFINKTSKLNLSIIALWVLGAIIFPIIAFIAWIILLAHAFRTSALWGLLVLFVPFALYFFLFLEYEGSKWKMFWLLHAPLFWSIFGILILSLL